mgnify:FL=1|jgi:exonuclease VII small subunit
MIHLKKAKEYESKRLERLIYKLESLIERFERVLKSFSS